MKNLAPVFLGIVENGKLELQDRIKFSMYLSRLKGEVEVIIRKRRRHRSLKENAYYWAVCVRMLAEEMGLIEEEVHDFLREKFLKKEIQIKGKMYKVIRSTTDLSTIEMEEYLENIRRWASIELQTVIPEPQNVEINE